MNKKTLDFYKKDSVLALQAIRLLVLLPIFLIIFSILNTAIVFGEGANSTINFQGKIVNQIGGTNLTSATTACVVDGGADTCDIRASIHGDTKNFAVDTGGNLTDGLVAYFDLEEESATERKDSVGNNDLSDTATVGVTTGGGGIIGEAADFSGTSRLWINDNAEMSTGNIDFTFSTWVYLNNIGSNREILQKDDSGQREYFLRYDSSSNNFWWRTFNGGTTQTGSVFSTVVPVTGTWYHIIAWYDAVNDEIGLQVDNGVPDIVATTGDIADATGTFRLGSHLGTGNYMNGRIDEVGFWKRLLTAQEKTDLYNSGNGNEYTGLLWRETHENIELGDSTGIFDLSLNSICNSWDAPSGSCSGSGITWGDDPTMYVELELDADGDADFIDSEIFSRTLINSVPFAYYTDTAGAFSDGTTAGDYVQVQPGSVQTVWSPYDITPSWAVREVNGTGDVNPRNMAIDSSGNVYVVGLFSGTVDFGGGGVSSTGNDYFVVKYNSSGSFLWMDNENSGAGDAYAYDIAIDDSGNVYVTGNFSGTVNFGEEDWASGTFVVKYNSANTYQWAIYTNINSGAPYGIATDSNGNVFISGFFTGTVDFGGGSWTATSSGADYFIVKYNSSGVYQAADREDGGTALDIRGYDVAIDSNDNVFFIGTKQGNGDIDVGDGTWSSISYNEYFIVKYDNNLNYISADRQDDGIAYVSVNSLAIDSSDNVFVRGFWSSTVDLGGGVEVTEVGETGSYFILKYSNSLNYLNSKIFTYTNPEYVTASSMYIDSSDFLYVTGYFQNSYDFGEGVFATDNPDYFITKYTTTDSLDYLWTAWEGGYAGSSSTNYAVADDSGNVYLLGSFISDAIDFGEGSWAPSSRDMFLVKLSDTTIVVDGDPIIYLNETGSATPDLLNLQSSGTNIFTVTNDGLVGIGGSTPDAFLDIAGATSAQAQIQFTTSSGVNPSAPNDGDWWWNGSEFYFNDGTVDQDLLSTPGIENPLYAQAGTVAHDSYLTLNHAAGTQDILLTGYIMDSSNDKYTELNDQQGQNHRLDDPALLGYWKMDDASGGLVDSKADTGFAVDTDGDLEISLVAYWPMDEMSGNRGDITGNGNTLTDYNTVDSVEGISGRAAEFDPSVVLEDLYIVDSANMSTGNIDFTFGTWVYLTDNSSPRTIIHKGDSSITNEYWLRYDSTVSSFVFDVYNSAGSIASVNTSSFGTHSLDTWYYLVAWHDSGGDTVNIQINNGSVYSTNTGGTAVQDSTGTVRIGLTLISVSLLFGLDGRLDEFGFWKKVLSAQERTDLYNSGAGNAYRPKKDLIQPTGADPLYRQVGKVENDQANTYFGFNQDEGSKLTDGLVAYYDMEQASGATRTDYYRSNDLTDNNGVASGSATGKVGNYAEFDYLNSEALSIADNTDMSTGDIDYTVSVWVYLSDKSAPRTIVSKTAASNLEYIMYYENTTDTFRFLVGNAAGTGWAATAIGTNFGSPDLNTWYHIVGWHSASSNQAGIQVNNGTPNIVLTTSATSDRTGSFYIGAYQSIGTYPWDGRIDEVGFWKRLLTAQEKTDLYNSTAGTTMNSSRTSYLGSAVDFDNSADYFCTGSSGTCADDDYFDINGTTISVGAWIKPDSLQNWDVIVSKRLNDVTANDAFWLAVGASGTYFNLNSGSTWMYTHYGTNVPVNEWTYVVGTYNGEYIKLYFNGELVASSVATGLINNSSGPLRIGNGAVSQLFDGRIDEAFMYDRTLSNQEIQLLYEFGVKKYKIEVEDNNNIRIYNFSEASQDLKLTAIDAAPAAGVLWTDGTNGLYSNIEAIIAGADSAFSYVSSAGAGDFKADGKGEIGGELFVGSNLFAGASSNSTETIGAAAFTPNGNDLYIAGSLGVEGDIYSDGDIQIQSGANTTSANTISIVFGGTNPEEFNWYGAEQAFMISDDLLPSVDDTYSLGSATQRWQDAYIGSSSLHIGLDGDEVILSYNLTGNFISFDFDGDGIGEFDMIDDNSTAFHINGSDAFMQLDPSTSTKPHLQLANSSGVNPSSPGSGDLWWNGTNLYFHDGATQYDLLALSTGAGQWLDGGTYIYPSNTSKVVVTDTGRVGIGNANPSVALEVSGNVEFSTNFDYEFDYELTNTSTELIDFDILLTVDTEALITAEKMQDDCDDIRFQDDEGNWIPYWIEGGCNTTTTQIWVRVTSIPNDVSGVNMLYGNENIGPGSYEFGQDFLMMSTSTIAQTCPEGWTYDSSFEDKFIRGSKSLSYGATGGSETHNHSTTFWSEWSNQTGVNGDVWGDTTPVNYLRWWHSHTINIIVADASHVPEYKTVQICKKNAEVWMDSTDFVGLFTSLPVSDWTNVSGMNSYFPRGGTSYGTTGGSSAAHSHSYPGGTTSAGPGWSSGVYAWYGAGEGDHSHTYSPETSTPTVSQPPYINTIFANRNSIGALPEGTIAMTSGIPPLGWEKYAPYEGVFPKSAATYDPVKYGADTHSHKFSGTTSTNGATMGAMGGLNNEDTGVSGAHSHDYDKDLVATALPPYKNILFYQKNTMPDALTIDEGSEGAASINAGFVFDGTKQNLGVGTGTPEVKFHVVGDGTYAAAFTNGYVGIGITDPEFPIEALSGARAEVDGTWYDVSDATVKYDIVDNPYGLSTVMQLQPRKFQFIINDENDIGFVAQEIELLIPEVVEGKPGGLLGLKYGHLTAVLTTALQELNLYVEDYANYFETNDLKVITLGEFSGDFIVRDHITVGVDTAGRGRILTGSLEVEVTFDTPYTNIPIINVSPSGDNQLSAGSIYSVDNESTTGFKIKIDIPQASDVEFNWYAIGTL